MKKILFIMIAVLLIAVSCSNFDSESTASVKFGRLEAKSTVSGEVAKVENLYWKYKATKADTGIKLGETDFTPITTDGSKGLGGEVSGFAPGQWTFQLQGYETKNSDGTYTDLIYQSEVSEEKTLAVGQTTDVSFNVDIQEGSKGKLKTVKPDKVVFGGVSYDYTVTCSGAYKDDSSITLTASTDGTVTDNIKQGLWTLTYSFKDTASNDLGSVTVTALIMNGATTTVTLTYDAQTGSFKASVNTPSNDSINWANEPKVGDTITFGTYPSAAPANTTNAVNANYTGKDVTWKVLAVDSTNKRALVISEKVLFNMQPYTAATSSNPSDYTYNWQGRNRCDINTYLNSSFLTDYGLSDVSMASVEHTTEAGTSTQPAENTSEKVFLLSVTEANTYFTSGNARIAYNLSGSAASWWLRSPGSDDSYYVARVDRSGGVITSGSGVYSSNGVRPAFWVNL